MQIFDVVLTKNKDTQFSWSLFALTWDFMAGLLPLSVLARHLPAWVWGDEKDESFKEPESVGNKEGRNSTYMVDIIVWVAKKK